MNHRARIPALLLVLALLLGCAGCGGGREPVTVTIWHVYGGETESPLNDLIDTFNDTVGREQNIRVQVGSVTNTNTIHEAVLASAYGEPGATALPGAATSRAGLYLRYSALRAIGATDQHITCFRGTAETARSAQVQMHNRWNPELNVQAVPGYTQLLRGSDGRLAERCLWMGRIALPDTWESVTLLCVPMLDSAYGSMVTVLAPIDGDRLLLGQAMIGSPGGSYLTADGTLTCKTGRYYNTYSDGSRTYLGLHEPIGATDAAGRKLAAVVLVPEIGLRTLEARSRMVWIAGSLVFLAAMLLLSTYLSRRFVTPISRSLQAIREQAPGEHPSGISEIDELLEKYSKGWKLSRMNKVDLTILRLGVYEMKYDEDIPERVAINEAVELAKKFGGDESPAFVNAVLAKLSSKEA